MSIKNRFISLQVCKVVATCFMLSAPISLNAYANDSDSSSSADFAAALNVVKSSNGVILRVQINDQGQENTVTADLRVYTGDEVKPEDLPKAFEKSVEASKQPVATGSGDSSTSWWGWNNWYGSGWYNPYYYYSYNPYYYYGSYYNYGNPYYYNYWYGNYGYRYYYYNRYY